MAIYSGIYTVETFTNSITLTIPTISGFYYYRCYYRPITTTDTQYKDTTSYNSSAIITITGLSANTDYVLHVYYCTNSADYHNNVNIYDYYYDYQQHTTVTVTTEAAQTTVDCNIYLNGNYDNTQTVNIGELLPYTKYFYPLNNTVLTSIRYNGNPVSSPGETFTVPNSDFTLDYRYSTLSYSYTTTESSITISIQQSPTGSPTYTWTLGSTTITNQQANFTGLTPNTPYTISVSIKLGTKEIGKGSTSVTTSTEDSKVWIYTSSGWKKATPWIYVNDTLKWQKAKAYIYTGSDWQPC